ncbi:MAG: hypothetical protein U0871_09095 [Gemmataceae bacterium]
MNLFALGFGVALAACLYGNLYRLSLTGSPSSSPWVQAAVFLGGALITVGAGWLGLRAVFTAVTKPDLPAAFRAADSSGWRSFLAGFLSGLAGIAAAVGSYYFAAPSGHERDPRTILAGLSIYACIGAGPIAGAVLFLWLFRPRPPQPPTGAS